MLAEFPWWLRVEHVLNIIFVTFLIRSGIEILATFPKLYREEDTPVGGAWAKFSVKDRPRHKYTPIASDYENYSPIVSLPGSGLLGQARYWHFITVIGYVLFTVVYWVLLFGTGQWRRYIPSDWSFFTTLYNDALSYLAFQIPAHPEGLPFNSLQQLSYAFVVFILPPFMIITGFFQSPAIANHWPKITKALGSRQVIRTLHWWGLAAYVIFIIAHVAMVVLHGYGAEVSKMVFGHDGNPVSGGVIFTIILLFIVLLHIIATRASLNRPSSVEKLHNVVVRPLTRSLLKLESRQNLSDDRISEDHRASGTPPNTEPYLAMIANDYEDDFVLEVGGLVERPMALSWKDLKQLSEEYNQTVLHHCVQGFSSVGKWGGVPLRELLELARPLPGATDVAVLCFQNMSRDDDHYTGGFYYETASMEEATQPQSLIAITLNDEHIPIKNGAPCRLRLETSTGFRSAKWIERVEVVNRYDIIGDGEGGFFEDTGDYDRLQTL